MKHYLSATDRPSSGRGADASAALRLRLTHAWENMRYGAGFTMIELMIVVAIIAILTAIAYPSYVTYITKSHRVAAEGCLMEYANYMERYYTTNLRYDQDTQATPVSNTLALAGLDCATPQQTGANYSYDFPAGAASASSYIIEAVPQNAQRSRDNKCGTLQLDQTGTRKVTGSAGVSQCW